MIHFAAYMCDSIKVPRGLGCVQCILVRDILVRDILVRTQHQCMLTIKSFNKESLVFHLDQFHLVENKGPANFHHFVFLLAFPSIPSHAPKQKKGKECHKTGAEFYYQYSPGGIGHYGIGKWTAQCIKL